MIVMQALTCIISDAYPSYLYVGICFFIHVAVAFLFECWKTAASLSLEFWVPGLIRITSEVTMDM